jgi:hypothetical protein
LYLVKNGVDYDVAFSLTPIELEAHVIALGMLDGGRYSFKEGRWLSKDE